jgi:hypothetical protein
MGEPEPVVRLHGDSNDPPTREVVVPSRAARHAPRRPVRWAVLLTAVGVVLITVSVSWLAGDDPAAPMAMAEATTPATTAPSRAGGLQACQTAVRQADAALQAAQ